MTKLDKVFVGWDSREDIAFQACVHSIKKYNQNIEVLPIRQYEVRDSGHYWREDDKKGSTEFTLTRFLVPALSNYEGFSVFMDCDMILRADIGKIMEQVEEENLVSCVQHDYSPETMIKMDGKVQHMYPRKNWSSVMVFNNEKCKEALNLHVVNEETPQFLHRMNWAGEKIGSLDCEWNYLVGYYHSREHPKLIHYTDGGPWFHNYRDVDYAELWKDEVRQWLEL
mgnify:CR=1 FL=1